MAEMCPICDQLSSLFSSLGHVGHDEQDLGSIEDVVWNSSCAVHTKLLIQALQLDSPSANNITCLKAGASRTRENQINLVGCDKNGRRRLTSWEWTLLPTDEHLKSKGEVKIVDAEWIDMDQVRGWRDRCEQLHKETCRESRGPRLESVHPKWLVDCKRNCLVPGTFGQSYVTLSYVWGGVQTFMTTIDKLNDLQQPGAFISSATYALLPLSIKHALVLTTLLDETYLWADCLCIVQDDPLTKHQDIQDMAGIYSNAALTIILTGPHANVGIGGISRHCGPREYMQDLYTLREGVTILQTARARRLLSPTQVNTWSQRAWTFQEDRFSQRRLVFQGGSVCWECRCAEYYEDQNETDGERESGDYDQWELAEAYPNTAGVWAQISAYNERLLTYPEDAHTAFSSILSEIATPFKGSFISGLPAADFDLGLLWQPDKPMKIRRNKVSSDKPLPSWSWLGWEGRLYQWSWNRNSDYLKSQYSRPCTEIVVPHIVWEFTIDDSGRTETVHNERYAYRYSCQEDDMPPPDGWVRSKYTPSSQDPDIPEPTIRPRFIFTHESITGKQFWYPLPLPDSHTDHPRPSLVHHIRTTTFKAQLFSDGMFEYPDGDARVVLALRNRAGVFAGSLRPNAYPFKLEDGIDPDLFDDDTGTICLDLVEISKGYAKERPKPQNEFNIDEWRYPERISDGTYYHFYNVMWVVWEGVIAYRRGLGRVEKSMWESLDRQPVQLTLG